MLGRKDLKMIISWGKAMAKKYFSDDKNKIKKEEKVSEKENEVKLSDDEKELLDMDEKINILEVLIILKHVKTLLFIKLIMFYNSLLINFYSYILSNI